MTNISILKLDMLLRFYKFNTTLNSDNEQKARSWSFDLINRANADDSLNGFVKAFEFNLRFTGQYEDSESGYYYNWHRFYNPVTGRYLTSDPISLAGGLNTYGYVGQNPYNGVDPWGLFAIAIWDDKVASNGKTTINIEIPILFTGPDVEIANQGYTNVWINGIEKAYTGIFGNFNINTKVILLKNESNCVTKSNYLISEKINNTFLRNPNTNSLIVDASNKTIPKYLPIAIEKGKSVNNSEYKTETIYNTIRVQKMSDCLKEKAELAKKKVEIKCNPYIERNRYSNSGFFPLDGTDEFTAIHETGHMLGIGFDPYFYEPANMQRWVRWNNIMSNPGASISSKPVEKGVDWLMFSLILDSQALVWKDGKHPIFETYDELKDLDNFAQNRLTRNQPAPSSQTVEDLEKAKASIVENANERKKLLAELNKK